MSALLPAARHSFSSVRHVHKEKTGGFVGARQLGGTLWPASAACTWEGTGPPATPRTCPPSTPSRALPGSTASDAVPLLPSLLIASCNLLDHAEEALPRLSEGAELILGTPGQIRRLSEARRDEAPSPAFLPTPYQPKRGPCPGFLTMANGALFAVCTGVSFQKRTLIGYNPSEYAQALTLLSAQVYPPYEPREAFIGLSGSFPGLRPGLLRAGVHQCRLRSQDPPLPPQLRLRGAALGLLD